MVSKGPGRETMAEGAVGERVVGEVRLVRGLVGRRHHRRRACLRCNGRGRARRRLDGDGDFLDLGLGDGSLGAALVMGKGKGHEGQHSEKGLHGDVCSEWSTRYVLQATRGSWKERMKRMAVLQSKERNRVDGL